MNNKNIDIDFPNILFLKVSFIIYIQPFFFLSQGSVHTWIPSIIFGIACLLAGAATIFLPETRNKHLFETVSQLEENALRKKNR